MDTSSFNYRQSLEKLQQVSTSRNRHQKVLYVGNKENNNNNSKQIYNYKNISSVENNSVSRRNNNGYSNAAVVVVQFDNDNNKRQELEKKFSPDEVCEDSLTVVECEDEDEDEEGDEDEESEELNCSMIGSKKFDRREKNNDQQFSIVNVGIERRKVQQTEATCRRNQKQKQLPLKKSCCYSTDSTTTNSSSGSLKSTSCDSSGFSSSEGSGRICTKGLSCGPANKERKSLASLQNRNGTERSLDRLKNLGLRSKVIDDLDRLLTEASRCSASPTDSYISCADSVLQRSDTTLTRGHEFRYSTLCRDEFSSFISQAEEQQQREQQTFAATAKQINRKREVEEQPDAMNVYERSGPMLVGVHENCGANKFTNNATFHQYTQSSPQSTSPPVSPEEEEDEEEDLFEVQEIVTRSPSDCTSIDSSLNRNEADLSPSLDKELILIEENKDQSEPTELCSNIESYLSRVRTLLKFSGDDAGSNEIKSVAEPQVVENLKLKIEDLLPPKESLIQTKIIQEIKTVSMDNEDEGEVEQSLIETIITEEDFLSILSAPQTSATLNWQNTAATSAIKQPVRAKKLLEELFLRSLCADSGLRVDNLVRGQVSRHISEFVESYNIYQSELKSLTSFANDWRQNWLFASKRRHNESTEHESNSLAKRQKVSVEEETEDLLRYSTLILSKYKPVKLAYLLMDINVDDTKCDFIRFSYENEESNFEELHRRLLESSRQVDACKLLSYELTDDEDDLNEKKRKKRCDVGREKGLNVNYYNSSLASKCNNFHFSAYGYLFECSNIKLNSNNNNSSKSRMKTLESLKEKLLNRLYQLIIVKRHQVHRLIYSPVKFAINLSNVELINKLPIIQFCAKLSGSLPILVRWFKISTGAGEEEEVEISCVKRIGNQTSVKVREPGQIHSSSRYNDWPLELMANYDYEYKNNWSSYYRFKRNQDDIIFEIRDASVANDYGCTYKCLIENSGSRDECSFSLDRKELAPIKSFPSEKVKKSEKRAILRTWSQRTLHKPQPQEHKAKEEELNLKKLSTCLKKRSEVDEDKFGKNFPYHPENLLKRLDENKFSPIKFKTLTRTKYSTAEPSETQFNDSFEALACCANVAAAAADQKLEEKTFKHHIEANYSTDLEVNQSQSNVQPKPRLSLKSTVTGASEQQTSRTSEPSITNKKEQVTSGHSKEKVLDERAESSTKDGREQEAPEPRANVKSLISRFSVV